MASSVPSLKLIKSFPFKGGFRTFSNRYHFLGGAPVDSGHWTSLILNAADFEKTVFSSDCTITEGIGYLAGSDVPVHTEIINLQGNLVPGSGVAKAPGEVAALLKFSTDARTIKNHPIYLFKYFHDIYVDTAAGGQDTLSPNQHTNIGNVASIWLSGLSDGTNAKTICSPRGAAATGFVVDSHVTHRDFPYTPSL
jgi:hypothetical protein